MKAFALLALAAATTILGPRFSSADSAATSADLLCAASNYHPQPIDRVIGDGGLNNVYPIHPTIGADGIATISRRLEYIESLLRSRDLSDWPADLVTERMKNLDRLHQYRLRAEYPINYDHPESSLPCFMDRDGKICAAGYLIQQSAGEDVAREINSRYQYSAIRQMNSPAVINWIARSGLTSKEVETIQVVEMEEREEPQTVAVGKDSLISRTSLAHRGTNGFTIRGGRPATNNFSAKDLENSIRTSVASDTVANPTTPATTQVAAQPSIR